MDSTLSTAALRQKMWKKGLPYSTKGSLESGMKEMNTAVNHSTLFTGSCSRPLLCLSALWRRGGRLVIQHALGSSQYMDGFTHLLTFSHFNETWLAFIFACLARGIAPNYDPLNWPGEWNSQWNKRENIRFPRDFNVWGSCNTRWSFTH